MFLIVNLNFNIKRKVIVLMISGTDEMCINVQINAYN